MPTTLQTFGGGTTDFILDPSNNAAPAPNTPYTVIDAVTMAAVTTGLLDALGNAATQLTSDGTGRYAGSAPLQGSAYYLDTVGANGLTYRFGPMVTISAVAGVADLMPQLGTIATRAENAETAAAAAQTAAEAAAAGATAPAATAIDTRLGGNAQGILDPASPDTKRVLTVAAGNSTFVPKWKASTAYLAGQAVVNPAGDVVTAKDDFTAGATYDAANWNLSPTFGPDAQLASGKIAPRDRFHADLYSGTDAQKIAAAAAAATAAGRGNVVQLSARVYDVGNGLSLSGYSCSIIGAGSSSASAGPTGTVIKASTQTGPVLDFTGYVWPYDFNARIMFEGFTVQGSGAAGAALKGIYMPKIAEGDGAKGVVIRDITVTKTGGTGFEAEYMYLSDIYNLVVTQPVSASSSDLPYVKLVGCNGNRWYGLGFRASTGTADTGPSGVLRIVGGTTFNSHDSVFYAPWFENLHAPTNGAFIVTQCNTTIIDSPQFFDCGKESGATSTAYIRVENATLVNAGGNLIRGLIPGRSGAANTLDYGVEVQQSGTGIQGVKGNRGFNVHYAVGVNYCTTMLVGAESASNNIAVQDDSGTTTNTIVDTVQGTWTIGGRAGGVVMKVNGMPAVESYFNLGTQTANFSLNMATANTWTITLGASLAINSVTNPYPAGGVLRLMLTQDATGSRLVLGWPANFKWAGSAAPTLSTAAGKTDVFTFLYDGTNWRETSRAIGT